MDTVTGSGHADTGETLSDRSFAAATRVSALEPVLVCCPRYTVGDIRAVVDLTRSQHEWLADKELDVGYYEGRLAYELGDWSLAEEKLKPVWESSADRRKRLFSGHFLGSIWARPDSGAHWDDAEATLLAAARLAAEMDDLRGEAMILNTLGALQVRRDEINKARGDHRRAEEVQRRLNRLAR